MPALSWPRRFYRAADHFGYSPPAASPWVSRARASGASPRSRCPIAASDCSDPALLPDRYSAIQLFVERAAQTEPAFRLTAAERAGRRPHLRSVGGNSAGAGAGRRARERAQPSNRSRSASSDRFHLLTQGPRNALTRQQTLEATIKWSFDLLEARDGELLRALSLFAGGWTLEAAERAGAEIGIDRDAVLDILARMVDRSLVIYEPDRTSPATGFSKRYVNTAAKSGWTRRRRAVPRSAISIIFSGWSRTPRRTCQALDQSVWFGRLEQEHDNVRAALDWSIAQPQCVERALRLAGALWRFWHRRGTSAWEGAISIAHWSSRETSAPRKRGADRRDRGGNAGLLSG